MAIVACNTIRVCLRVAIDDLFSNMRGMRFLLATASGVFLLTFLVGPRAGAGWFWDSGNALGFAAFAGMLCLTVTGSRRTELKAHQSLGYVVLLITAAHAFWFLLGDSVTATYLEPGAPLYMWVGVLALVLLGVSVSAALMPDRLRVHRNYGTFRKWHLAIAILALLAALYHVIASNFYVDSGIEALLLVGLTAGIAFGRSSLRQWFHPGTATIAVYVGTSIALSVVFVLIRNLPS